MSDVRKKNTSGTKENFSLSINNNLKTIKKGVNSSPFRFQVLNPRSIFENGEEQLLLKRKGRIILVLHDKS